VGAFPTQQLAVHVKHCAAARTLVEVIDVLRDQCHVISPALLQSRQGPMRLIRLDLRQLRPSSIVKFMHHRRIAAQSLRARYVLNPMPFPKTIRIAKCRNT
jgi:hypothetical protein